MTAAAAGQGREGGADHRHRGRQQPASAPEEQDEAEAKAVRTTIDELKARLSATCSSNCRNWIAVIAPLRHSRSGESTGGYATGANISSMGGALEGHARRCRWPVRGPSRAEGNVLQSVLDLRDSAAGSSTSA